jgi:Anti-sigma-K factor rskA.
MPCEGLTAENYDLYVLGLADDEIRLQIDGHLDDNCSACYEGVRRSLGLWTLYASTLQDAQPSDSLRARLVHLADLTKRVVNLPTRVPVYRRAGRGVIEGIAAAIAVLVAVASWYAGTRYSQLKNQQLTAELDDAQQRVASLQVSLKEERAKFNQAQQVLKNAGKPGAANEQEAMRQRLLHLEADVNQYKAVIARDQASVAENLRVINTMSEPGVRFVPLKGLEPAPAAIAYSLVVENAKVLVVASNLPALKPAKRYQLWLLRRDDPKVVSGGVFAPDDNDRAVIEFSDGELINNISALAVTVEPAGGSSLPTGARVLSTAGE